MRNPTSTLAPALAAAFALLLAGAPPAAAAPADVPAKLTYQGVLLDDLGAPRTGVVDLVVRIYDQAAGGTLLYTQAFAATPLSAGAFTLVVGPTGEATDAPDDPLTTSLADVFAGDLVAGPGRHLELTVGGDPALARVQVLAAPLALRAASAAQADAADTATEATTVTTVNGVEALAFSEIWEHVNFDGGPPNDDPSEGTGDTDGDGIANFVDPDNDNDGLSDELEVSQGSNINLVTPDITSVTPSEGNFALSHVVTVGGTHFEPGISVVFGSENPAPSNVTPTSFEVTVGPQMHGPVDVRVTRSNGETTLEPGAFTFTATLPTLTAVTPASGLFDQQTLVTVTGTNFEAGLTVDFGSQQPTPTNVSPTSFDVLVGPVAIPQTVDVQVTRLDGLSATLADAFLFEPPALLHGLANVRFSTFGVNAAQGLLIGRNSDDYSVDLDGDGTLDLHLNVTGDGVADFAWDPSGLLQGLRCSVAGADCTVWAMRDTDGDGLADVQQAIETFSGSVSSLLLSSAVAFRPDGRPVRAYVRGRFDPGQSADVVVAVDDDGDGDWSDPGDLVVLESGLDDADVEVAVDGLGRAAVLQRLFPGGGGPASLALAWDRTADGDFGDVDERQTVHAGDTSCFAVAADTADRLAILYQAAGGASGPTLVHDLDDDGVLGEPGETTSLGSTPAGACSLVALTGGGLAVATDVGGATVRLDRNADGDFDDPSETVVLSNVSSSGLALAPTASNGASLLTETRVLSGF